VLSIRHLKTYFRIPAGVSRAVDGVSLDIGPGQVMGVVGESVCGKSVMALSILGLLPSPPAFFPAVNPLHNQDLLKLAPCSSAGASNQSA
jgi:ABC-type dipeptide/oligopeptide/nickel transport system ATPase component